LSQLSAYNQEQSNDEGRVRRKQFGVHGGISSGSWRPGQSGNPNGRPKPIVDIAALARKHGPRCIEVAARLLSSKDEKMRLAAAIALLDRGFGRPKQEIETSGNATIELHLVAARVISQELLTQVREPPAIEHEAITDNEHDTPTE
jgi:hypothetical protein